MECSEGDIAFDLCDKVFVIYLVILRAKGQKEAGSKKNRHLIRLCIICFRVSNERLCRDKQGILCPYFPLNI